MANEKRCSFHAAADAVKARVLESSALNLMGGCNSRITERSLCSPPQPAVKRSQNYRVRDSLTQPHKYVFATLSLFTPPQISSHSAAVGVPRRASDLFLSFL